jgi:pseudouridine kinase
VPPYTTAGDGEREPMVLVLGAMAVDAKGRPAQALLPGTSTPGNVRLGVGGVGRNIAENLARLGVHTILMSAVGDDPVGRILLEATANSGIDVEQVVIRKGCRSGAYIEIWDQTGARALAIDDMNVMSALTPELVYRKRRLIRDASMIVLDANVPPKTLASVFNLTSRYDRPVCVDPTSAVLAPRIQPYLPHIHLLVPNLQEARALAGLRSDEEMDVQHLAIRLVNMGVDIAIITLAEQGLYYATAEESGHVSALARDVVDLTGVGDALAAATVFGLLNCFPVSEAVRLGISAAALTIQCPETVCPDLSLDRLYDELVI